MTLGIIIGFEYGKPTSGSRLATFPGTIVDIHHAYNFCKASNMKTVIISDIEQKKLPKDIMAPMVDGFINPSIMSFVEETEERMLLVNTAKDLINTLISIMQANSDEKRVFFYYSGHGDPSGTGISMPNNERVRYMQFRDILTKYSHDECQILMILDCCHPTNLALAYTLTNSSALGQKGEQALPGNGKSGKSGRFVDPTSMLMRDRIDGKFSAERFLLNATFTACKKEIVLITSSNKEEKSAASRHDSFFSRYFFMYLMLLLKEEGARPSRNLGVIREVIGEQLREKRLIQTMTVHSSYNMVPLLWCWIGSMKSDIRIDYGSKTIYMKPL